MEDTRKRNAGINKENTRNAAIATTDLLRPYSRPQVLSAEGLEAAAATCDPQEPVLGKTIPIPCGTLGS